MSSFGQMSRAGRFGVLALVLVLVIAVLAAANMRMNGGSEEAASNVSNTARTTTTSTTELAITTMTTLPTTEVDLAASVSTPTVPPTTTTTAAPTTTTTPPPSVQAAAPPTTFKGKLVGREDFNSNKLTGWSLYNGAGTSGVGMRTPSMQTVNNGVLSIGKDGQKIGGMSQNFGQTYGRWTIRAKMDKGQGYAPAVLLWPDSEKWPEDGEIDIFEMPQADRQKFGTTIHYGSDNKQVAKSVTGDFTQWHTYTVDWLPDRLVFYLDGVEYYRVTDKAAIPDKPMHLAMQLDLGVCGNAWIGCPDASTPKNVALHIDYVEVYALS